MFRDDDKEGKDFVEASIDDIMKRAATKVGWVGGGVHVHFVCLVCGYRLLL